MCVCVCVCVCVWCVCVCVCVWCVCVYGNKGVSFKEDQNKCPRLPKQT